MIAVTHETEQAAQQADAYALHFFTLVSSPLVVTEYGPGFLDQRGHVHLTHGIHVSPPPKKLRRASRDEAAQWYASRQRIHAELAAYYARTTYTGD